MAVPQPCYVLIDLYGQCQQVGVIGSYMALMGSYGVVMGSLWDVGPQGFGMWGSQGPAMS